MDPDPTKSAFVPIHRLPRMIWSVDHVGAQWAWASSLRGESSTDYYAEQVGRYVEGEDYPFGAGPSGTGNRVSKRHAGNFNAAFYDGSVESFNWGASQRSDWTGGQ
jgi:prepilin-type processing-associated H-X9-DG protein